MPRKRRSKDRASVQLGQDASIRPETAAKREVLHNKFAVWVAAMVGLQIYIVAQSGIILGTALKAYGRHLCYNNWPLYILPKQLMQSLIDSWNSSLSLHLHGGLSLSGS